MCHFFLFMAPNLYEFVNPFGTFGDILFNGSAGALVKLLAVPVPPAHSSLDHAWSHKSQRCSEGRLSPGCPSAKRKRGDLEEQPARDWKRPKVQRGSQLQERKRTSIHTLPAELHDLIIDHLDMDDVFNLCISNRYFWNIGLGRIRDYIMSHLGTWADERIVCVGNGVPDADYPPAMYTDDERARYREQLDEMNLWEFHEYEEFIHVGRVDVPDTFYRQLKRPDTASDLPQLGSYASCVLAEARPDLRSFYPVDQPWILRNLTTKEYVRSEAIALKPEHIHGPHIDHIGFGEVVMSRICWTADGAEIGMEPGNIRRGVWAGHRFDITTLARHNKETKKDDWRDISKEVAEELAKIWETEYGSNWREKIMCGDFHWHVETDCRNDPGSLRARKW
ncbi:hypothetical protein SLS58_011158 [Diplodia intermedia]|uniref:F-box domain-containing protein n=1 Tax=Diplodia intermedia TaxID=856260 RepID=A0ABR3T122_9PEZI